MRKRIFIWLTLLLALTGCIYDKYAPDYCPQEGKEYYLAFILNPQGDPVTPQTKAMPGGYDATADVSEHLVKKVDLYFYNGGGAYLGKETVTTFTQTVTSAASDPVSNRIGNFSVKLSYRPYRLLTVINQDIDLAGKSIQEARAAIQSLTTAYCGSDVSVSYVKDGTQMVLDNVTPFYMSSSTYMNGADVENCDVLIPAFYLRTSSAEALANPLPVYLERMAAKVVLKTDKLEYEVPVVTSQDNVTAKVTLLSWGVNALNRFNYYFKKIDSSWSWSSWEWKNAGKYRSHWAQDPNYLALEQSGIVLEPQASTLPTDPFKFLKPSELAGTFTLGSGIYSGSLYCPENTADGATLPVTDSDSRSLYSRITHIVVKARLSFGLGKGALTDEDGFTVSDADIFRYNGVFYTKKSLLAVLRKEAGLSVVSDSDLNLESAAGLAYCKAYDNAERVAVKQISTDTWLDLKVGGEPVHIDGFKGGIFYYKIPIEHINNEDVIGTEYPTGRYGVVRNYIYEVYLDSVGGIGTGIWDSNLDIRPFRKSSEYDVSAYVKVSPWKQYETQFYFVDPSGMLVTDGQRVNRWSDIGPEAPDWDGDGWYE